MRRIQKLAALLAVQSVGWLMGCADPASDPDAGITVVRTGEAEMSKPTARTTSIAESVALVPVPLTAQMLSQRHLGGFEPDAIVDGDVSTLGWHTDNSPVGSLPLDNPPGAVLTIDLGTRRAIVRLGVYAAGPTTNTLYYIQVSDDALNWQHTNAGAIIVSDGWSYASWEGGNSLLVGAHRYWRLVLQDATSPGPWMTELAAWSDGDDYLDLPLAATMLSESGLTSFTAAAIVDRNTATNGWHTDEAEAGATLTVDLGAARQVYQVNVYRPWDTLPFSLASYFIDASDDGVGWTQVGNLYVQYLGWNGAAWRNVGPHRYWRLRLMGTPGPGPWLSELQFLVVDEVPEKVLLGSGMLGAQGLSAFRPIGCVDGDPSTYGWHTDDAAPGAYLMTVLPGPRRVTEIAVFRVPDSIGVVPGTHRVQSSDDGQVWKDEGVPLRLSHVGWNTLKLLGDEPHVFWRLQLMDTPGPAAWLGEFELYATH